MDFAHHEAARKHEYLGPEHILLSLIRARCNVALAVMQELGVELDEIRSAIERTLPGGPDDVPRGKGEQTPQTKAVIECMLEEARYLAHDYIGTEHILLGILRQKENVAAQALASVGLKLEEARAKVILLLGTKSNH